MSSSEEEERVARHLATDNGDSWENLSEEQREVYATVARAHILQQGSIDAERKPEETVMQIGAFTFTRRSYGRVALDVDIESQVLPRELTAQEAVQLARFLVRDEELLRDITEQTDKK